jgi:hypothetical protein
LKEIETSSAWFSLRAMKIMSSAPPSRTAWTSRAAIAAAGIRRDLVACASLGTPDSESVLDPTTSIGGFEVCCRVMKYRSEVARF